MTPSKSKAIRVAAICESGATQQQIVSAMSSQEEFQLVDILGNLDRLSADIRACEPSILIIDHHIGGRVTIDVLDDLTLQFPDIALVAILPGEDPAAAQQVTLAGAWVFMIQPFTQANLLSTLRRVNALQARRAPVHSDARAVEIEQAGPLHTISVFGPRGGAGCTTVALNLAIALKEATNKSVLLLEGKLFFGHLDVMLNIRTQNTLADLIPHANALDADLVKDVVVRHVSGIDVILAPKDIQFSQGIRSQDFYNVLTGLQRLYDLVVIDSGSSLSEITVTQMDAADRILLVANPDMASLHDVTRFIQISRTLAYPPEKIVTILNRTGVQGGVRTKDIAIALKYELFDQIPDDGPNVLRSLNRGIPLLLKYPRSPASRKIQSLAKSLTSQAISGIELSPNGSKPKSMKKSSKKIAAYSVKNAPAK